MSHRWYGHRIYRCDVLWFWVLWVDFVLAWRGQIRSSQPAWRLVHRGYNSGGVRQMWGNRCISQDIPKTWSRERLPLYLTDFEYPACEISSLRALKVWFERRRPSRDIALWRQYWVLVWRFCAQNISHYRASENPVYFKSSRLLWQRVLFHQLCRLNVSPEVSIKKPP